VVKVEDTLTATPLEDEFDLVVLAVGLEPRSDDRKIIDLLRLSQSPDRFFLEAHPKLRPVDTASDRCLSGRVLPGSQGYSRYRSPGQRGGCFGFDSAGPGQSGHRMPR